MTRALGRLGGAVCVLGVLAVALPASAPAAPTRGPVATMELAAQTPVVSAGGTFAVQLRLDGVPADGLIEVVLHQRVRSRSELEVSRDGDGLRTQAFRTAVPIDSMPEQPDGTRELVLAPPLQFEGVYPVVLNAQDAAENDLASLVTHLIMAPEEGDDAPPLGVALIAELDAPPALQPDGTVALDRDDVEDIAGTIAALTEVPEVPVSIAARPETIDALASSPEAADGELVEALRTALPGRTVLGLPYADVSPDDLAPAGLLGELGQQLAHGAQVVVDALGAAPANGVWLAPPDLGADGIAALSAAGIVRVVVEADQVDPLDPRLLRFSLAQPFRLTGPEATSPGTAEPPSVQALATDPTVMEHLEAAESDGMVASRVLSELALLRLERPSLARSMVLPVPDDVPARVIELILEGLDAGRPFAPMSVDQAFDHATPLLDGGGNPVERALAPVTSTPIRTLEANRLLSARAELDTFRGLIGPDSPRAEPLARHLLLATAAGLTATQRRAHIETVETAIATVAGGVSTPATFTLTLTAREGTVPLTIRNDSGEPLHVKVRLSSQKLEFPDGDTIDQMLTEPTTRIDIVVRARASGAFPLEVDVTTPDGRRSLSVTRYTVRSTAVSGVGLVLSGGAGLFLIVWWARHWRRTRRSAKLIAADAHPASG